MSIAHSKTQRPLNTEKKMARIFGIDLGTTNSLIAAMENGEPRVIPVGENGSALLPSVVAIAPDGAVTVGERASEMGASAQSVLLVANTAPSFDRLNATWDWAATRSRLKIARATRLPISAAR